MCFRVLRVYISILTCSPKVFWRVGPLLNEVTRVLFSFESDFLFFVVTVLARGPSYGLFGTDS